MKLIKGLSIQPKIINQIIEIIRQKVLKIQTNGTREASFGWINAC